VKRDFTEPAIYAAVLAAPWAHRVPDKLRAALRPVRLGVKP